MKQIEYKTYNRREFIKESSRKIVLGGLGILGVSLGIQSLTSEACAETIPCQICSKAGNCQDTKADEMKREKRKSDSENASSNDGEKHVR